MKSDGIIFFLFTCVKDGAPFINSLFDSLLQQTSTNFVHFIYEDGSNLPLGDKVEEYKNRVRLLEHPYEVIYECNNTNIGLNKSTEHCLQKCQNQYAIWINCDDWIDKHFFDKITKYIQKNPNFCLYNTHKITITNNKKQNLNHSKIRFLKLHSQRNVCIADRYEFTHFIINLKFLDMVNPNRLLVEDKYLYNDVQLLIPFVVMDYKFGFIKKAYSYFLTRKDSESNANHSQYRDPAILCERLQINDKYLEYFTVKKQFEDLTKLLKEKNGIICKINCSRKFIKSFVEYKFSIWNFKNRFLLLFLWYCFCLKSIFFNSIKMNRKD